MSTNRPITWKSNEYWGQKYGSVTDKYDSKYRINGGERVIKQISGAFAHAEHSAPHGKQLRFYPQRALRRKLGKHGLKPK